MFAAWGRFVYRRRRRVVTLVAAPLAFAAMAYAAQSTATLGSGGWLRVLLVPATLRLMGRWNWWAPGVLGGLADRVGFSHVETSAAAGERPAPEPSPLG